MDGGVIDEQELDLGSAIEARTRRLIGDDQGSAAVLEHEAQPLRRIPGIERNIGRADSVDREQRADHLGGTRHRHGDQGAWSCSARAEVERDSLQAPAKLRVGDPLAGVLDRDRLRPEFDLPREARGDQRAVKRRLELAGQLADPRRRQ